MTKTKKRLTRSLNKKRVMFDKEYDEEKIIEVQKVRGYTENFGLKRFSIKVQINHIIKKIAREGAEKIYKVFTENPLTKEIIVSKKTIPAFFRFEDLSFISKSGELKWLQMYIELNQAEMKMERRWMRICEQVEEVTGTIVRIASSSQKKRGLFVVTKECDHQQKKKNNRKYIPSDWLDLLNTWRIYQSCETKSEEEYEQKCLSWTKYKAFFPNW